MRSKIIINSTRQSEHSEEPGRRKRRPERVERELRKSVKPGRRLAAPRPTDRPTDRPASELEASTY
jgi:hypothetical protein